jgi:hypothetical protein
VTIGRAPTNNAKCSGLPLNFFNVLFVLKVY